MSGVPLAPTLLSVVHTFNLRGNGIALHLKELDVAVILGIYKSMVVPLKRRSERQQQGRKPQVLTGLDEGMVLELKKKSEQRMETLKGAFEVGG